MIMEDFERESQKDSVYLLEAKIQEEQDFWMWYHMQQKPAKIVIIDERKILNENEQPSKSEVLPF